MQIAFLPQSYFHGAFSILALSLIAIHFRDIKLTFHGSSFLIAVSYTHLTLPTILRV